ncbi:transcriptional regulator [Psychromonas sp. MB-3u-54]|uniref:GntR family transcriptional regulator n=1 Tax=Psychromonas sp. MB-3u-54 TaxID=2058319 RepID=UPI000C331A11|nr:GntR family transcriptional regulator [Psychromonas sp. MB-3u-54]PKH04046.1 transcriptional regulator [Psychromonas sp. MB-3u-54]
MAKISLYRQIADTIRTKIHSGDYKVGEVIPTEAELREEFSVSRVTIRQALKLLIANGELESVQGSGTYVKENKVNYNIYQQPSFKEKWAHLNVATHSDVMTFEIIRPSILMAENLNINENDRIFYIKRVRYIDDNPIKVEETWLPLALFPDLTYEVMQKSKYDFIEKTKGLVIDRSEQEIIPILPSAEVSALLGIDPNLPIIEKRTRSYLQDNTVFEYSRNFFKSTDYKFTLVAKRH